MITSIIPVLMIALPAPNVAIYTPEQYKFITDGNMAHIEITGSLTENGKFPYQRMFRCQWPSCACPLRTVTGAFHHEKIDWIIEQRKKDPNFKVKINI
jgi:hypothetical protein